MSAIHILSHKASPKRLFYTLFRVPLKMQVENVIYNKILTLL
jgi:hypothetical protein